LQDRSRLVKLFRHAIFHHTSSIQFAAR
jgi:hypothetical protein